MDLWLIFVIVFAVIILLLLIFALLIDKIAFGKRSDTSPLLKYYTSDEFGLSCESIRINKLQGFLYFDRNAEQNDKLMVFCHGMGPGQIAYTTEIAYFCRCGYSVLALDSTGCNFTPGKSIRGFYEGVRTAVAAVDYAKKRFPEKKVVLVGHSWGAYSALCASREREVEAVVAISAPDSPAKMVAEQASSLISRPLAAVICPFFYLINFIKFGRNGNANAARRAETSGVRTLLIHGDCDKVVPECRAVYFRAESENITKLLVQGKKHNPYNTVAAENYLAEIISAHHRIGKMTEEQKQFFKSIDFSVATEEDETVMSSIVDFLNKS